MIYFKYLYYIQSCEESFDYRRKLASVWIFGLNMFIFKTGIFNIGWKNQIRDLIRSLKDLWISFLWVFEVVDSIISIQAFSLLSSF